MRLKNAYVLLAACSITLLTTRHRIHELTGALRTYATFYPYLSKYPETLYRYHGSANTEILDRATHKIVPAIIHQIFLKDDGEASLNRYKPAISSCSALHPSWTHNIWTDETAAIFIAQHYPEIWPHYISYKQTVQRANILRYALLDHFGGVYLDLDVTCLQPLDNLRHLPWLTPGAYPAGLNNAFMLSRPRHPFLTYLLAEVEKSDLSWGLPYLETMLSTGCMFLSTRWMTYARLSSNQRDKLGDEERVYVLADENGEVGPHMLRGVVTTPLFQHGGASSWHDWDAAVILLIGKNYHYFLTMMGFGALFAVVMIWSFSKRTNFWRQTRRCMRSRWVMVDKSSDGKVIFV